MVLSESMLTNMLSDAYDAGYAAALARIKNTIDKIEVPVEKGYKVYVRMRVGLDDYMDEPYDDVIYNSYLEASNVLTDAQTMAMRDNHILDCFIREVEK